MPESNPEMYRLLAERTNRALCLFRYFGDRCSRLRMCLEFLDVSLRPFATHCFAVLLWLRNFQLVSSLFDGGRVLTHRRAETTKQKLKIAPSRQRKWSADDQNGAIDRDKARRLKTTFWRVITIGCACRLVAYLPRNAAVSAELPKEGAEPLDKGNSGIDRSPGDPSFGAPTKGPRRQPLPPRTAKQVGSAAPIPVQIL